MNCAVTFAVTKGVRDRALDSIARFVQVAGSLREGFLVEFRER